MSLFFVITKSINLPGNLDNSTSNILKVFLQQFFRKSYKMCIKWYTTPEICICRYLVLIPGEVMCCGMPFVHASRLLLGEGSKASEMFIKYAEYFAKFFDS